VVFQAVLLQILINRPVIPVDNRQQLKDAALDSQHRASSPAAGRIYRCWLSSAASLSCCRLSTGITGRFISDFIVLLNAFNALLPQFAVTRFLPGGAFRRPVDFNSSSFGIQAAVSLHLVNQLRPDIPVILTDTGYLFPHCTSQCLQRPAPTVCRNALPARRRFPSPGRL
jgi:hypothetical protein